MLTVKLLQTKQKIKILGSESRVYEKWQTLIWRPGDTAQNLESPGLSGRVESTVYLEREEKIIGYSNFANDVT